MHTWRSCYLPRVSGPPSPCTPCWLQPHKPVPPGRPSPSCVVRSWWNRYVANPIKFNGYTGKGRRAMLILKNQIMPRILLRRTKVQCADDLALPPR
jgi:hypothetical protein